MKKNTVSRLTIDQLVNVQLTLVKTHKQRPLMIAFIMF